MTVSLIRVAGLIFVRCFSRGRVDRVGEPKREKGCEKHRQPNRLVGARGDNKRALLGRTQNPFHTDNNQGKTLVALLRIAWGFWSWSRKKKPTGGRESARVRGCEGAEKNAGVVVEVKQRWSAVRMAQINKIESKKKKRKMLHNNEPVLQPLEGGRKRTYGGGGGGGGGDCGVE